MVLERRAAEMRREGDGESIVSHWFLKTLPVTPYSSKTWRGKTAKSLILKDRTDEGVLLN
jgi:hypothetical protein